MVYFYNTFLKKYLYVFYVSHNLSFHLGCLKNYPFPTQNLFGLGLGYKTYFCNSYGWNKQVAVGKGFLTKFFSYCTLRKGEILIESDETMKFLLASWYNETSILAFFNFHIKFHTLPHWNDSMQRILRFINRCTSIILRIAETLICTSESVSHVAV